MPQFKNNIYIIFGERERELGKQKTEFSDEYQVTRRGKLRLKLHGAGWMG